MRKSTSLPPTPLPSPLRVVRRSPINNYRGNVVEDRHTSAAATTIANFKKLGAGRRFGETASRVAPTNCFSTSNPHNPHLQCSPPTPLPRFSNELCSRFSPNLFLTRLSPRPLSSTTTVSCTLATCDWSHPLGWYFVINSPPPRCYGNAMDLYRNLVYRVHIVL